MSDRRRGPGGEPQAALPRELGEFLVELAIALQKHGMYPDGHPSLDAVADRVVDRLNLLLRDRGAVSLGVVREQLVVEGVATDAGHPVLSQLARRLHGHFLDAVKLLPGVTAEELAEVLRSLAGDPARPGGRPIGLESGDALSWPHVKLHPMSLDQLQLVQEPERDPTRAARLWVELARAAVAEREDEEVPTDPGVIAEAIEGRPACSADDEVMGDCLAEIARELRSGKRTPTESLRRRIHGLVEHLSPETLQRLVRMGDDRSRQRRFMLDANATLPADAVLKLLTAMASAASRPLSESLLPLLSRLALHAGGNVAGAPEADAELRDVVARMLEGWALDDPDPAGYAFTAAGLAPVGESGADPDPGRRPEPERILQMCLEADAVGPPLERALDRLIEERRIGGILDVLADAPRNGAADATWDLLAAHDRLARVIGHPDVRTDRIEPLIQRIGADAGPLLLHAMCESEDRSSRRAAFDLLVRLGRPILPHVDARLDDERWFVLRNLLAVHNELGTAPEAAVEGRLLSHPDPRVRREAVKIGLRAPDHRTAVLRTALADDDERVVRIGLVAALDGVPAHTVPLVAARAGDDALSTSVRVAAVRVLGRLDHAVALSTLLGLASEGKGIFGGVKLAPTTPITVAAVKALADGWADDPHAASVLERARQSKEDAVRRAAAGAGT